MNMDKFIYLLRILKFSLLSLILSFGFWVYGGSTEETQEAKKANSLLDSDKLISMDFQEANFNNVLKVLSKQSGLNFIASQEVEDYKITLYLEKVPVKDAMDKLLMANKLDYELFEDSKIILIKTPEPVTKPKITKVFLLRYARVSNSPINREISDILGGGDEQGDTGGATAGVFRGEGEEAAGGTGGGEGITAAISQLLSKGGSVIEDARTNALVVRDFEERFPIIEKTINELDIPVPQVSLEVEMLDVSKNLVDKLGFDFAENPLTFITHGHRHTRFFLGDLGVRGANIDTASVEGNLLLGNAYGVLLNFLKTQTDTKYLARPRILTLNNETAEIKIVTDEVIGEEVQYDDTGNVTSRTAERSDTGVSLRITPQVNLETGEITMFLSPKVIEAATSSFSANYRDPEERGTNSLVKVRDGETVVAGGLIRNITYETTKKLPILGDIPVFGVLFRHKHKSKDKERELLVFITPHIVKDPLVPFLKEGKVSLPSAESDISARLMTIDSTLNSFNSTKY